MNRLEESNYIKFYEGYWIEQQNLTKLNKDMNNKEFPSLHKRLKKNKKIKKTFIKHLNKLEKIMYNSKMFIEHEPIHCLICKKNISNISYNLNHRYWDQGYIHYIKNHKLAPTYEFRMLINGIKIVNNTIVNIPPISRIDYSAFYVNIDQNQINIMDALFKNGSKKNYISLKDNAKYLYSEHTGLLQISNSGLDKIIISGRTNRISNNDPEIYLPNNDLNIYNYEYMFHTHPSTPKPGSRIKDGVLYEFPSINDIYNFIENYNYGITTGSIVIAPEGIYIIRRDIIDKKKVTISDPDKTRKLLDKYMFKIQDDAIKKYAEYIVNNNISTKIFYSKIIKDRTFIDSFNNLLNKIHIHIDYYPRVKNNNNWIVKELSLPLYIYKR
jgi:hypothetical protein